MGKRTIKALIEKFVRFFEEFLKLEDWGFDKAPFHIDILGEDSVGTIDVGSQSTMVFFIFDICSEDSLQFVLSKSKQLQSISTLESFLIANKSDLEYWRRVSTSYFCQLARKIATPVVEMSTISGENVYLLLDAVFNRVFSDFRPPAFENALSEVARRVDSNSLQNTEMHEALLKYITRERGQSTNYCQLTIVLRILLLLVFILSLFLVNFCNLERKIQRKADVCTMSRPPTSPSPSIFGFLPSLHSTSASSTNVYSPTRSPVPETELSSMSTSPLFTRETRAKL